MGLATFCAWFILPALSACALTDERNARFTFNSRAVTPDVWPVFTLLTSGGFQGKRLLQPSGISELELSFPQSLQTWDVLNRGTNFALSFMNSSWQGLAEASVYQRGALMYLQASASAVPGHKLYIQSCYATPSPDPADESRDALILNRGCVSSKRSVIKFVSRQNDSINLLLNTSMLKFSQVYVHCSIVLSHYGPTSDTKSCNYNKNTSRWVELGGQTGVCDCCASRCRGSPYSGRVLREFTVMVSTGPAAIVEHLQVTWPVIGASQVDTAASDSGKDWLVSGATPSSIERGWIVSETSVADGFGRNELNSSPWLSQSELTDVMVINQDLGDALSLWLPGLIVDIQSAPVFKMGAGSSQTKGRQVDGPSLSNASTKYWLSDYEPEGEPLKMSSELQPPSQDPTGVVVEYVADMMDLSSDGLKYTDALQEEELRGDVFMNFRPHTHLDTSPKHVPLVHTDDPLSLLYDAPKNEVPEEPKGKDEVVVLTQTEMLLKRVKDVQLEPMRLSKLSLTQGLDGSSSLSYEERPRSPNMDQEHGRKGVGEGRRNQLGTEKLVVSLLDLLMGLSKAVKLMHPV